MTVTEFQARFLTLERFVLGNFMNKREGREVFG